jgi:uncharacterized membrane protein
MLDQLLSLRIPAEVIVMAIAALPIAELRLAIPVGIHTFGMAWYSALPLSVVGNMLPVPILLLFLDFFVRVLSLVRPGKKLVDWVFERTRRHEKNMRKYEWLGLAIFVGIPLPATGAWTGSILAFLMGLRFFPSMLSIFLGVIIAGAIVTALSLLGWIGAIIAGVALTAMLIVGWWRI